MSENINGGLAFAATLDINDFKVSSEAMERRIRSVSDTAVQESERMEQSIAAFAQNGARYIIGTLVGGGMMGLVNSIVQTRGQFQQLQIAFDTMLGSGAKSKALMDQLTNTAAKTPFDLMGVAGGAKQLLAYGSSADKVNDTLIRLGNIASGLSIPLNDIVYLYGTTMVQGRLYAQDVRQFTGRGIPLVRELAAMYGKTAEEINTMVSEGKIGFPEVEKVINKMTDSGGQFYNLMERQSKSLSGMISNLGDSWDMALNKLGEQNQGVLESGISGAITVVEHLDDVLNVIKAIAISYGSYRAAIVLNTLATKGNTGISLIDNTVRQAKIALMKADEVATGRAVAVTAKMTAVQEAHTASLQKQLTVEEQANLAKQLRIATIEQLLTAQQQEYLSNLNVTTSSANYEAVAMSVLSVEQRESLSKTDLSSKSAIYQAALEREVLAKNQSTVATMAAMREDVKAAAVKMETAKLNAISSMQAVESARYQLYWAKQSGDVTRIATAEKRLEAAVESQAIARKTALAASSDFYAKKKVLETTATRQSTVASVADTAAKETQTVATSLLDTATNKLSLGLKALWATMKANPIGWIVSILGIAYIAYEMFFKKQEDGTETIIGLAKATKDASEEFGKQAAKVDTLKKIINDGNISYFERNKALNELKQIIPGYNAELTKEGKIINDNTDAIEKYLAQLEKQIKLKAAQDELEQAYKKKRDLEKTESSQSDDYWNKRQNNTLHGYDRSSFVAKTIRLFGIDDEENAKKALDETRNDIETVNETINDLNKEISDTSLSFDESSKSVKTYSKQISETISQINSIKKEISDLRSGKVLKDNIAEEIENRTKDLKTAETKLSILTGKKTPTANSAETADNKSQQLAEKQIQAELKAEQSRIDIMDEGYAKRKALLELQHKQNIAQINKEEKELEKARREAGKGGLSSKEKSEFDARRINENASYSKAQNKLFDGEIEYKKSQYELYWRWVKNMGDDVAKERFKDLLKSGTSYKDYVEKEIQNLTLKKSNGTISEGESNYLINLNTQLDEITGKKSALDVFKESLSKAISNANTLAEKMKVISDYKEKIKNGQSNLVGADEKAAGLLAMDKEADDFNSLLDQRTKGVLESYKDIERQKKEAEVKYNEDIELLNKARLKATTEDEKKQIDETIRNRKSAFDGETAELNSQIMKSSEFYTKFFEDSSKKGYATLKTFATQMSTVIEEATISKDKMGKSFATISIPTLDDNGNQIKKSITITLEEFARLKEKLVEMDAELGQRNPFQKLVDGFKKVADAAKSKDKDKLGDALKELSSGFDDSLAVVSNWGDSIGSMLGEGTQDAFKEIESFIKGAADLGFGIGRIASGDIVGGITQTLSGIASVYKTITGWQEKQAAYQRKLYLGEIEYQRALRDRNFELQASTEYLAAFAKEQEMLNWLIKNGFVKQGSASQYSILGKQYGDAMESLKAEAKTWDDLFSKIREQGEADTGMQSTGSLSWERSTWSLKNYNAEQLKQLDAQGLLKGATKEWYDAWVASGEKVEELTQKVAELKEQMATLTLGSSFDDFLGGVMDALEQSKGDITDYANFTESTIKKALLNSFKYQILSEALKPFYDELSDKFLSKEDITSDWVKDWSARMQKMMGENWDKLKETFDLAGIDINSSSSSSEDPMSGAVKSMSEETAGIVAGRLNAVIINQSDGLSLLRQSLLVHQQIAANTAYCKKLEDIDATLKQMQNSGGGSSLLSKGIS